MIRKTDSRSPARGGMAPIAGRVTIPAGATRAAVAAVLLAAAGGGCVERELVAESEPAGALVSMNDQEAGRTPLARDFQWYGTYDVTVRHDGYETLRTRTPVIAPPWLWAPFDFLAEVLPVTIRDVHRSRYVLQPTTNETVDTRLMVGRARELRGRLESGERPADSTPRLARTSATSSGGLELP